MNWLTLGPKTLLALVGCAAAVLVALHFLRVRRRKRTVATLLFWRSVVEAQRARRLGGPLRHLATLAWLFLACAVMLMALADPRPAELPARCVVVDASVVARGQEAWLRQRAEALGALEAGTHLLVACGGNVDCFPARGGLAARREALAALTGHEGVADLDGLLARAQALVRGETTGEVLLVSARAPRRPWSPEISVHLAPQPSPWPATPDHPDANGVALQVEASLPRMAHAFADLPLLSGPGFTVILREGARAGELPSAALRPLLMQRFGPELNATLPAPAAACTHGLPLEAGWRSALVMGDMPLVRVRKEETRALLEVAPGLFTEGSALAESPSFQAWMLHWILAAGQSESPSVALEAGSKFLVRSGAEDTFVAAGVAAAPSSATPASYALVTPDRAGPLRCEGRETGAVRVHWPEATEASSPALVQTASAGWPLWIWFVLAALLMLCADAVWHGRGRAP